MKILKRLLIAIGLSIAMLVAIAFALPNQFNVARSVTINAPAEKFTPSSPPPANGKIGACGTGAIPT